MIHKKMLVTIISCMCFIINPVHPQSFQKKFDYNTISIDLTNPTTGALSSTLQIDYSDNQEYKSVIKSQGDHGYELVRIDRWSYVLPSGGLYKHGITLIFKKEINEWEKYIIDRADSVANAVAKKEINRAEADILNWVNGNKTAYTKEFTDKITSMFEGMLKEYYERIKQDIIDTLNKKDK